MKVVNLAFTAFFIAIKLLQVESKFINLSKKTPKHYTGVCNLNGTLIRAITSKSNPYMRISSGYRGNKNHNIMIYYWLLFTKLPIQIPIVQISS